MKKQKEIDAKRCHCSLKRCEKKLLFAIQLLRDIDMKINHIIEKLKYYEMNADG